MVLLRLLAVCLALAALPWPSAQALTGFSVLTLNASAPWAGRSSAGLVSLPFAVTYANYSFAVNTSYPAATVASPLLNPTTPAGLFNMATGALSAAVSLTATMPANSLYLWGGACGHNVNSASGISGDPDVWASSDGGLSWQFISGQKGFFGSNTYGAEVQYLSASTPGFYGGGWSYPRTALYPTISIAAPTGYSETPNANSLYDPVHQRFYVLAGDYYTSSGHWPTSQLVQSSGGPALNATNSTTPVILNQAAVGWTNGIVNTSTGAFALPAQAFPARSLAAATVDSVGNLYLMNGISSWNFTDDLPIALLADVYMSADLGNTWLPRNLNPPWTNGTQNTVGRMESGAASYHSSYYGSDLVFLLGGCSVSITYNASNTVVGLQELAYNDVYASADRGATWYTITLAAAWPARCGMTALAAASGVMVVVGGRGAEAYGTETWPGYYTTTLGLTTLTDIWTSLDGGYTCQQQQRYAHTHRTALQCTAHALFRS